MTKEQIGILIMSILLVVCVFLSGFFSMCDMAYSNANTLTIEKESKKGSKKATLALTHIHTFDETLSSVVFSNNLVNIAASSITAILGIKIFIICGSDEVFANEYGPYISAIILMLIIIAFGEVLPKAIGRIYSTQLAIIFAPIIKFLKIIFYPFVKLTTKIGDSINKPILENISNDEDNVSNEVLQEMVDKIEEEGVIDESQGELVRNAIEFKETEAHEIMTPRVNVFAFDIDEPIENLINNENIYEYSRIPVYKDSIDNVIGILPTKLLLKELLKGNKIELSTLLIPEINVPSGLNISSILDIFQKKHIHIAVVKDEFGGTEGILTMEDIIEELTGEIWDEFDEPVKEIVEKDDNTFIVSGSMNLDDFFNEYNLDREKVDTNYDTLGGWCIDVLQDFPKKGDSFDYENLHIEIVSCDEFTVEKVKVFVENNQDENQEE